MRSDPIFEYGDTVYWVTFGIRGNVSREHGDLQEGLPLAPRITFEVHHGLVIEARPDNEGIDVYGGTKLHHLRNAEVYPSRHDAETDAHAQLSSIEVVEMKGRPKPKKPRTSE